MKKPYILCAAIYYDDGKEYFHMPLNIKSGVVVAHRRHAQCFIILKEIFPDREYLNNHIEGFLTSDNRFVDRKEAFEIALQAEQQLLIESISLVKRELESEHLY